MNLQHTQGQDTHTHAHRHAHTAHTAHTAQSASVWAVTVLAPVVLFDMMLNGAAHSERHLTLTPLASHEKTLHEETNESSGPSWVPHDRAKFTPSAVNKVTAVHSA